MWCTSGQAYDDASVSPVVRQTLLHWAYELHEADFKQAASFPAAHHPCCTLAAHPCCTPLLHTLAAHPCCTRCGTLYPTAPSIHLRCTPQLHCTPHPTAPLTTYHLTTPPTNLLFNYHLSTPPTISLLSHYSRASLRLPLPAADCARRVPSASRRTAPPTCRGSS